MYRNLDGKITREKYFEMCDQLGHDPNPDDIPPDLNDFPDIVQYAIITFNMLGDRIYPEIGYIGKDYTNLPIFIDFYEIEDKELFLEILNWLDARAIQKSSEQLKREYDKLKRKSSGSGRR